MPVYEFECNSCHQRVSIFIKQVGASLLAVCPHCGSHDLTRLISSFAYHRSLDTIHAESGGPDNPGPDYYKDPRNIGRWTEKKFQEMGTEMPHQVQEMIQAAREGEMPPAVKEIAPNVKEI